MSAPLWILDAGGRAVHDAKGLLFALDDERMNVDDLPALQIASAAPDLVAALVVARQLFANVLDRLAHHGEGGAWDHVLSESMADMRAALVETGPALARALGTVPAAEPRRQSQAWPWA